jgi:hypothetical protein
MYLQIQRCTMQQQLSRLFNILTFYSNIYTGRDFEPKVSRLTFSPDVIFDQSKSLRMF